MQCLQVYLQVFYCDRDGLMFQPKWFIGLLESIVFIGLPQLPEFAGFIGFTRLKKGNSTVEFIYLPTISRRPSNMPAPYLPSQNRCILAHMPCLPRFSQVFHHHRFGIQHRQWHRDWKDLQVIRLCSH